MEERQCRNCGAHLVSEGMGRWRCEYCGSVYETDCYRGEITFVEISRPQPRKLVAQVILPNEARLQHPETLSGYTLGQLRNQLADALATVMRVTVEDHPFCQETIVRGEICVIPPREQS